MSTIVSVTKIARHLAEYINRVVYRNESFTLVRGNKNVAELRPVPMGRRLGDLPALLDDLPHLTVEEADVFDKDLEDIRDERLEGEGLKDPWAT